ncbi:MAG: molecular chaperone DnaK [Sumerlaeia bacterium]
MASESKIIGIDLGTTNSVVAVMVGNEPEVIPNAEGANKTPSVVAFLDNGEVVVGEIARRQASTNASRTISSVKRLMGRAYEELEDEIHLFPFELVDHNGELYVDVDGMGYRPEQISALVLKKLKECAETYLNEDVEKAVITVPAYFDDLQRQATIEAAEMAGLDVLRLINEPTAAAMAYGMGRGGGEKEEIVAVYDFGGGTFDITLLEISEKTFEVLTSTGDSLLGGDDLDNAIVTLIMDEFQAKHGVDLAEDPVTVRRLKEVAERAKCELSTTTQASLSLPFIAYRDNQPLHLERILTREEFEDLIDEFVRRTIRCCKRALEDAGLKKRDIVKIIMVGGTTRIPLVQESVEDFFDQEPFRGVNPDEVVALGAATQAGVFEGNVQEVILLDVTPHSLGIEVEGGRTSRIIEKNSTIPIKAAKTFTTTEESQEFVNIHVLQGEESDSAENRSLGKFQLTGIGSAPAGVPRIRVTFFINADGVMEISAEDVNTGQANAMTIVHSQLNEDERNRRSRRRKRNRDKTAPPADERRRKRRGRHRDGTDSGRKGSSSSVAAGAVAPPPPTALPSSTDRPAQTPPPSPAPTAPRGEDSPTGRSRRRRDDSTGTAQAPPQFAVLGDTNPGGGGHGVKARAHSNPSDTLSPLVYDRAKDKGQQEQPVPSSDDEQTKDRKRGGGRVAAVSVTDDFHDMKTEAIDRSVMESLDKGSPSPPANDRPLPDNVLDALDLAETGAEDTSASETYADAVKILTGLPEPQRHQFTALRALAYLRMTLGQPEETRQALRNLREHHGKSRGADVVGLHQRAYDRFAIPMFLRDLGLAREKAGDLPGACQAFEQALRKDPAETDRQDLERIYRSLISVGEDPASQFKLVKILLKSNRVDEAIEVLQDLQRYPSYENRAMKILGLCHWQKNMHYLAWQHFKGLPVDDDMQDILYRLAADMEGNDQLQTALAVLQHLHQHAPHYRDLDARLRKLEYRLRLQADDSQEQRPEDLILPRDSRFTVLEEINRGSMGIIYRARDNTLNEIVALKVLNDYLCSDPAAVERFKSEARAAKRLGHQHIVRIHEFFELDNKRFISMEYIEGTDLKRLLAERTTFTEEMVLQYFMQICDALAYAHSLGVIHRDIKPANIMITTNNSVKITDFGIAKILRGDDVTKSGTAVIGTPLYMAPEQIIGDPVDQRTDIYSLGIMMYELLSGNPPFYLGNIEYHHIHTAPPQLPSSISQRVQTVIMKMIAKDPSERFQKVNDIMPAIKTGAFL